MGKGRITQVIGTVVDVEFPRNELPSLFNALEVPTPKGKTILEVESHIGNFKVRCVALAPTEGLPRGAEVVDTGKPLVVPVGPATLGRMFNVMGEATRQAWVQLITAERWPNHHRPPPLLQDQEADKRKSWRLGIKVIDLISPLRAAVRSAPTAAPGVGKTVMIIQELIRSRPVAELRLLRVRRRRRALPRRQRPVA